MRKFFSILLLCTFLLNGFGAKVLAAGVNDAPSLVSPNSILKPQNRNFSGEQSISSSKSILEQRAKGKDYVKTIDAFLEKNKSVETLEKLISRIETVKQSGKVKDEFTSALVNYIYLSAQKSLNDLKAKELKETDVKNTGILNPTISEADKKVAAERILKIQNDFYNTVKAEFEKYNKLYLENAYAKQKGDFKFELSARDIDEKNTLYQKLNLKDLESQTSGSDAELRAKVEVETKTKSDGKIDLNVNVDSNLEAIIKGDDVYLLLKTINVKDNFGTDKEFTQFLDKLKEISASNKYLKIGNEEYKQLQGLMGNNPDSQLNELKKLTEKPLFEAYKKEGNKYYLRPTQDSCALNKSLGSISDPFKEKCSDAEYKKEVQNFAKNTEIYLTMDGDDSRLDITGNDEYVKAKGYLSFSSKELKEVKFDLNFPSVKNENNATASLYYKKNSELNFNFKSKEANITFESKLNGENNFSYINAKATSKEFNGFLKLENSKLNGELTIDSFGDKFTAKVNGELDSLGKLTKLDVSATAKNLDSNFIPQSGEFNLKIDTLTTKLKGANGIFTGETEIKDVVKINHNISLYQDKIIIDDSFTVDNKVLPNDTKDVTGNVRLNLQASSGYFDIDLEVKANSKNIEILDLKLKANSFKTPIDKYEIKAPTEYQDAKKVFAPTNVEKSK
ncbi:hypothetical protein HXK64_01075 [Candidatus Gracilibacteria bacterium]|nr:hypothetical protein [Candidatus Gracilibacteria bacterium]